MHRYFFNLYDGKRTYTDKYGVKLSGIAAARKHARAQILEIKGAPHLEPIQDWKGWVLIISDVNGKIVGEINFTTQHA